MSAFNTYKVMFPHPDVDRMHTSNYNPNYKSIKAAAVKLNANDIHLNGKDGKHVHLILTVSYKEHQAMSNRGVAFAIPTVSPIHPVYHVGTTGPVITDTNRGHI